MSGPIRPTDAFTRMVPVARPPQHTARVAPGAASALGLKTGFDYSGVPLPGLSQAVSWRPRTGGLTGTQANMRVTETYHALDQAMSRYLGEPALPNWMTFGKYASREVGGQVIRLEELMKISEAYDPEAAIDTVKDFLRNGVMLSEQGVALLRLSKNPVAMVRNATAIRDALVAGNTGVYGDIAPAFDTFLRAETAGGDGVEALRTAGYGRAPKDAQGLLLRAFVDYQRAGREHATLSPAARQALIHRATMTIGNHEQLVVLQGPRMFGDPEIGRLLATLSSQLSVTDVRGSQPLLPHGGNWADFATRMGYDEVPPATPEAFTLIDHAGVTHHYAPSADPRKREGTIGAYFVSGLNAVGARQMIDATPSPLPPAYDDVNGLVEGSRRILDALRRQLDALPRRTHR